MRSVPFCLGMLFLASVGGVRASMICDCITDDPNLPPFAPHKPAVYITGAGNHASFGGTFNMLNVQHKPKSNPAGPHPPIRTDVGPNEIEDFGSTLTGLLSISGGPGIPFILDGPVSVEAFDKVGHVTGTFDTQMLSMDLTGNIGGHAVEVMLDPARPTTGQVSIEDVGGGMFRISSFFDVFTELSIDHSPFIPQDNGPTHVFLTSCPEPSTFLPLVTAAALLMRKRWMRRT